MTSRDTYRDLATQGFAQHGFHGLSLAALAKEAGVSKQAVLHHFKTKEALYGEVLSALADRLLAELTTTEGDTPAARLKTYFTAHAENSFADNTDAQLVMRAILDSTTSARNWPLTPYLDALTDLAAELPAWKDADRADILAGLYLLIGALQYAAISETTLTGMYGADHHSRMRTTIRARFATSIDAFINGD